jgi:hypothetical protein
MVMLVGKHSVKDFEAWKKAAMANMSSADRNKEFGILDSAMYRTLDGGVLVTHKFNDVEAAKKYKAAMESAEMRAQLEPIGVVYPMTIWIAEELEEFAPSRM